MRALDITVNCILHATHLLTSRVLVDARDPLLLPEDPEGDLDCVGRHGVRGSWPSHYHSCSLCTIVCSLWSGLRWADVGIRFPVSALGLAPARAQAPPRTAGRVLAATSAHHSFLVTPSLHFIRFDPDTPLPTGADSYNLKILKLLAMIGCFGSS